METFDKMRLNEIKMRVGFISFHTQKAKTEAPEARGTRQERIKLIKSIISSGGGSVAQRKTIHFISLQLI